MRHEITYVIPIFPNGDVLMNIVHRPEVLVEQRRNSSIKTRILRHPLSLKPEDSLEFLIGRLDLEKNEVTIDILTTLVGNMGGDIHKEVETTRRIDPLCFSVEDLVISIQMIVIRLPEMSHFNFVEIEGIDAIDTNIRGILRLSEKEFMTTRYTGITQEAMTDICWSFVQEIRNPMGLTAMERYGAAITDTMIWC